MSARIDELNRLIRQYQMRLEKARKEAELLEGEIRGLIAARNLFTHGDVQSNSELSLSSGRDLSSEWRTILSYFDQVAPQPVTIDELMHFIDARHLRINRNAVRSQLHHYVKRRYLERLDDGVYRATPLMRELL